MSAYHLSIFGTTLLTTFHWCRGSTLGSSRLLPLLPHRWRQFRDHMEPRWRVLPICHKEQREAQHVSQHGDYLARGLIDCLDP